MAAKKLKNEAQLVKEAIRIGTLYVKNRGVCQFEETDSAWQKMQYIYKLLVHDKMLQPLPKGDEHEANIKHKLAVWISKKLPPDHPLLK